MSWKKLCVVASFCSLLGGCGHLTKSSVPEAAMVTITASADINPNRDGMASPIVIKIFSLKDDSSFKDASFFALYGSSEAQTVILLPGQSTTVNIPNRTGVTTVGAMAAFKSLNNTSWKAEAPLGQKLTLNVSATEINFVGEPS